MTNRTKGYIELKNIYLCVHKAGFVEKKVLASKVFN